MLCEKCRQNEANCHLTIIGERGVVKSRNLCNDCYEAGEPGALNRGSRCFYCGGEACSGGTDIFSIVTGKPSQKFMCGPCLKEYGRYIEQHLQPASAELPRQKQLALLRKLNAETEKHMKRWASKKGPR